MRKSRLVGPNPGKYPQKLGGGLKTGGKVAQEVRRVSKGRGVSVGKGKAGEFKKNPAQLDQFYQTVVIQTLNIVQ